jgi:hypothetical protein
MFKFTHDDLLSGHKEEFGDSEDFVVQVYEGIEDEGYEIQEIEHTCVEAYGALGALFLATKI